METACTGALSDDSERRTGTAMEPVFYRREHRADRADRCRGGDRTSMEPDLTGGSTRYCTGLLSRGERTARAFHLSAGAPIMVNPRRRKRSHRNEALIGRSTANNWANG
jgi:hypothetical protein